MLVSQPKNLDILISWDEDYSLSWNDFRYVNKDTVTITTRRGNTPTALSFLQISRSLSILDGAIDMDVYCYFNATKSFTSDTSIFFY